MRLSFYQWNGNIMSTLLQFHTAYICEMEINYRLEELNEVAGKLLVNKEQHTVWAFYGEMGSGKTTLIHAICNTMGMEGSFGSPTFSIINEYSAGDDTIFHIDLYRCKDEEEAIRAGVEDCLYSGNFCLVEWPSRAEGIFPPGTLRLTITVTGEFTRKLTIGPAD